MRTPEHALERETDAKLFAPWSIWYLLSHLSWRKQRRLSVGPRATAHAVHVAQPG